MSTVAGGVAHGLFSCVSGHLLLALRTLASPGLNPDAQADVFGKIYMVDAPI